MQPMINVKARIFKDVSPRSTKCVLLKESEVNYKKLAQLTLFCKQQGIPVELFGPACYRFIDYWPRFFPYFELHEAYYEYSEAGDFGLTICYYKKPNRLKGQTRNLREKTPNLFAVCLREVELKKIARKDKELSNRQAKIDDLEEKYKFLKKRSKHDIKEKSHHLTTLLSKYEEIELEKQVLAQETTYKEQTIESLQEVLQDLEKELSTVKQELQTEQKNSQLLIQQSVADEKKSRIQPSRLKEKSRAVPEEAAKEEKAAEPLSVGSRRAENNSNQIFKKIPIAQTEEAIFQTESFLKETNIEVKIAYQREFEWQIKERFRESQRPTADTKIRLAANDYTELSSNLENLQSLWDRLPEVDLSELEVAFFEWCEPYLQQFAVFNESLKTQMKKEVFRKATYLTTKATLHKLQGYSLLIIYLEEIINSQDIRRLELLSEMN